ncbi:MAG TPA: FecR domain-containing protein [Burkholderiales bacterium]|nr:FecR domain-containing protein [Burkholderiales bacterium]
MKLPFVGLRLVALCLSLLPALAVAATPSIGRVSQMTGDRLGNAQAPGAPARKLAAGDAVFAGERIRTGAGTVLQIEFTDKTRFTLGPNAEFEVSRYSHATGGAAEEESFHSRIFKGAFRFVSGLVARTKRKDMRVSVSVATIGIRGTHVEGEVIERQEKDGAMVDASAKVALLEPEGADAPSAIVVENQFGSVVIDKPGYGTEIPDEKSPPSPVKRMQLRTIDNVTRAIRSPARTGGPARRP